MIGGQSERLHKFDLETSLVILPATGLYVASFNGHSFWKLSRKASESSVRSRSRQIHEDPR